MIFRTRALASESIFDMPNESKTFTCVICHETFDKGWSDEEAKAELDDAFPTLNEGDCDLVCDDCYKQLPEWMKSIAG